MRILYGGGSATDEDMDALKLLAKLDHATEYDAVGQYSRLMRSISTLERRRVMPRKKWTQMIPYAIAASVVGIVSVIGVWLFKHATDMTNEDSSPIAVLEDHVLSPYSPGTAGEDVLLRLSDGRVWKMAHSDAVISTSRVKEEIGPVSHDTEATVTVPNMRMASLELGDGTVVDLNSDSSVSFLLAVDGDSRSMRLNKGEAYLNVVKDLRHPFTLDVGDASIRVLGTQFNVNMRSESSTTTLVEGSIELSNNISDAILRLKPGEQVTVEGEKNSVSIVDVADITAWKDGKYIFKSKPLNEILEQVTRWYGLEFSVLDPDILDQSLTGVFYKDYSPEFVLKLIEEAAAVRASVDDSGKFQLYR